jgi:hypothetical protein
MMRATDKAFAMAMLGAIAFTIASCVQAYVYA